MMEGRRYSASVLCVIVARRAEALDSEGARDNGQDVGVFGELP